MMGWVGRVLAEALPALALLGVGDFLAGMYLGAHSATLATVPGLLTLLPVIMGLRGNIFSILSAKTSTIIHVEGLMGLKSTEMRRTIGSLLFSKTVLPMISIFLAYLYYSSIGRGSMDLPGVLFVVYSSSAVMFPIILVFLMTITIVGFRFGMDPDHYGIPLIMGFADVLALLFLTHFASLGRFSPWVPAAVILGMLLTSALLGIKVRMLKAAIFAQLLAVLLDLVAGAILERNLEVISRHIAFLVILPLVNSELGGIGGIISSKYSTNLHLGTLEPSLQPRGHHARYLAVSTILGILLFSIMSLAAWLVGEVSIPSLVLLSAAGIAMSAIAWLSAHALTTFSYLHGLDPDLLSPPAVTGMMDVLGTLLIFLVSTCC